MTGERELDATAILEYFEPLMEYLINENKMSEQELEEFLIDYEEKASTNLKELVTAEWNFATDVENATKEEEQVDAKIVKKLKRNNF